MTVLRLAAILTGATSVFSSTVSDLVLIYESVTSSAAPVRWLTLQAEQWTTEQISEFSNDRPTIRSRSHIATDGQSVSKSWCRAPPGAHDQIFITVWHLRSCFCEAPSLTRGRVCLLYMLLAIASAVFLGSKSLSNQSLNLLYICLAYWIGDTESNSSFLRFHETANCIAVGRNVYLAVAQQPTCTLLRRCLFRRHYLCNGFTCHSIYIYVCVRVCHSYVSKFINSLPLPWTSFLLFYSVLSS
jgi:hypothetical protein